MREAITLPKTQREELKARLSDIVNELQGLPHVVASVREARDRIALLEGALEKTRAALKVFAVPWRLIERGYGPSGVKETDTFRSGCAWTGADGEKRTLTYGDFRQAAQALAETEVGGE